MTEPKILREDKHLLIVEKPPEMLSEPDGSGEDILTFASRHTGRETFLVHRLDRNTGGLMVIAKIKEAAGALSAMIAGRSFEKEYLAVVKGCPEEASGTFEDLLYKDPRRNKTFVVTRKRNGVKEASLSYRVRETLPHEKHGCVSLVSVRLHTGRTHQIRVQFSSRGMPLLGDGKYGSLENRCETALWSARLSFVHPFTKEKIEVFSFPPKEAYPWNLFSKENDI